MCGRFCATHTWQIFVTYICHGILIFVAIDFYFFNLQAFNVIQFNFLFA